MTDSATAGKSGACLPGASPPLRLFFLSVMKLGVQMGCQSCVDGGWLLQLYRSYMNLRDAMCRRDGVHPVFYPESLSWGGTIH